MWVLRIVHYADVWKHTAKNSSCALGILMMKLVITIRDFPTFHPDP
jgi:hypothetical protein